MPEVLSHLVRFCLSEDALKGEYLYALDARTIADILTSGESKHCCHMVFPPSAGANRDEINRWCELHFRKNSKSGYVPIFVSLLIFVIATLLIVRSLAHDDWPITETAQLYLVLTALFLPIWLTHSIKFTSKTMIFASGSDSSQGKSKVVNLIKHFNKWEAKHPRGAKVIAFILLIGALASAEIFITFSDTLFEILFNINLPQNTSSDPKNSLQIISAVVTLAMNLLLLYCAAAQCYKHWEKKTICGIADSYLDGILITLVSFNLLALLFLVIMSFANDINSSYDTSFIVTILTAEVNACSFFLDRPSFSHIH
ncbi:hypothetical protein ACTNC1_05305 [Atopobiaceae bacterium HCP3S3_A4]